MYICPSALHHLGLHLLRLISSKTASDHLPISSVCLLDLELLPKLPWLTFKYGLISSVANSSTDAVSKHFALVRTLQFADSRSQHELLIPLSDESFGLGLGLTNMDDRDPETAPYSTSYPFLEQNIIPVPDYGMEAGQLQWVIDDNDEPWAGLEYPQSPPISEECNSSSTNVSVKVQKESTI